MSSDSSSSHSYLQLRSRRIANVDHRTENPAMDDQDSNKEGPRPGKRAITMKILAAVAVSAVVVAILAAIGMSLYHHKEEVIPEVKDFAKQRMADVEALWANVDLSKDNNYFADFFKWKKNKKYMVEIIPKFEGNNYIMDLFSGKKKKYDVKITGI